jgi:bifunctional non-homologous end joining protein LigD
MSSSKAQVAQVGKRRLELSNLDKLLFPGAGLTKAHLLEYYLTSAQTLLAHIQGRPLSLLRYPEGITGEAFFQKNRPGWAPDWLDHAKLGEEKTDYLMASEPAALAWLANLACIELHQMHARAPHFDKPDYIVYDFDPPGGYRFAEVAELAVTFKEHVEGFGYHAFVKTTGRKGLHVVTPIEAKWGTHEVFDAAKAVAQPFVERLGTRLTLQIKKDQRQGKVLLDVYRNRASQTIVAAYSLRGIEGAPVSTPLHWEELEGLQSPSGFNLLTIPARLTTSGDPWEGISGYATAIHTVKRAPPKVTAVAKKTLEPARTNKTPEQLESYASKRRFDKTAEPPAAQITAGGSAFVVHRHHATRLHYDLRLEEGGVLRSWAVPKGLPPRPGIKRMAIRVEDHPLEYVDFEGVIPKGEYGGGTMWKFARGRHEITKQKPDGFYFRLHSPELSGEYRVHNTKENQWLLERVDTPPLDWLNMPVEPMLARAAETPPASAVYVYEVKWDGIRAVISVDEGTVRIRGRNGMDLTQQFPELTNAEMALRVSSAVLDGEIVCLEADGKPNFRNVISRMQQTTAGQVDRARAKYPAVCYVFDCLYLDGRPIVNEALTRRREWVKDLIKSGSAYRVSDGFEDGVALFEATRTMGLEGVMAKQRKSTYLPGKRSDAWLKIKSRHTTECVIIGYTQGQGGREAEFGALHLGHLDAQELRYVGKVGSGFTEKVLAAVFKELEQLTRTSRPVKQKPLDHARSVWVEPKLMCEVAYASITRDGILREPVFIRLRPDLNYSA